MGMLLHHHFEQVAPKAEAKPEVKAEPKVVTPEAEPVKVEKKKKQ